MHSNIWGQEREIEFYEMDEVNIVNVYRKIIIINENNQPPTQIIKQIRYLKAKDKLEEIFKEHLYLGSFFISKWLSSNECFKNPNPNPSITSFCDTSNIDRSAVLSDLLESELNYQTAKVDLILEFYDIYMNATMDNKSRGEYSRIILSIITQRPLISFQDVYFFNR